MYKGKEPLENFDKYMALLCKGCGSTKISKIMSHLQDLKGDVVFLQEDTFTQ